MKFIQRVALVTGAGRGIGAATALRLAQEGCDVAVNDIDGEACHRIVAQICDLGVRAIPVPCNVCDAQQVKEMVKWAVGEFGHLDILINNAGITNDGTLLKLSAEKFNQVIEVNLCAPFLCMQQAAIYMKAQGYGRIINLSSISGVAGNFGQGNYAASKAGLIGLSKVAALELGKYGITVNCIAPGFVDSDMTKAIPETIRQKRIAEIPRGMPGTQEEIASAIAYLASDETGFINGAVLHINGGCYMA